MPIITVKTNVAEDKIPKGVQGELTDIGADFLKKPKEVIWVELEAGRNLTQGGTSDPVATVSVECIGRLKPSLNLAMGRRIEDVIIEKLGVNRDRIVVRFFSVQALYCTYNGALHDIRIDYDEDL
ncbi:MIF-like protein mif-2 [Aplysia californica]|uniref:MIF-like protein mif-2 n=1 Tax=Aplysia californica TaxID=6500 RepID=A0ABM0JX49_APLCA|nr:MIF-like protein mif-2 [Aplysia californica]